MVFKSPKPKPLIVPPEVEEEESESLFRNVVGRGNHFLRSVFTSAKGLKPGLKTKLGGGE